MGKKAAFKILLPFALLLWFIAYSQSKIPQVAFQWDEHTWISNGAVFFDLAFIKHDFADPEWNNWMSYAQSKLPEYAYGAVLYIAYKQSPLTTLNELAWGTTTTRKPDTDWVQQVHTPIHQIPQQFQKDIDILLLCRHLSMLVGAACLVLIFLIGRQLVDYFFGITVAILLAINPLFQSEVITAKADGMFLFFFLSTFSLSLHYIRKPSVKKLIFMSIAAGCTAAAKLHGLFVVFILTIGIAGYHMIHKQFVHELVHIAAIPLIAFSIFTVINPFIWMNPLGNTTRMIYFLRETSFNLCGRWPENCAPTIKQRLINLQYDLIGPANEYNTFHQIPWLDSLLLVIGGVFLLRMWKRNHWQYLWILFWGCAIVFVLTSAMIVRFPRYYIIYLPWTCMVEAFGIMNIIHAMRIFLNTKRARS